MGCYHERVFSSRFHWDLRPNRLTELLASKRRAGTHILDLTESNPTHAELPYPADDILAALADPRSLVYDPAPAGSAEARSAVSSYYAARGYTVSPERILLTSSTSEAYTYLFKLLADPGDEVLVPRPSYPLFEYLAAMESVRVAQYPLVYHEGWSMDIGAISRAITERTRAVILVNPNNPTGSFVKKGELEELVALCTARGIAIISDEVFADFTFQPDAARVTSLAGLEGVPAFSMSGLSKVAGLPQMKLGWIVVAGPERLRKETMERLEWIADTYLSVSTPVQHAARRFLTIAEQMQGHIARRVRENLDWFHAAPGADSPCRILHVEGGWYATLQVPRIRTEEEWVLELLAASDVLVQPGFFYDFDAEAFLVLSLLTPPEIFREGAKRLLAAVEAATAGLH